MKCLVFPAVCVDHNNSLGHSLVLVNEAASDRKRSRDVTAPMAWSVDGFNEFTFHDCWFLTGATAVGKTAVGIALAQRLGAEIISLDSMAIYRGMDIGTAKPSREQRAACAAPFDRHRRSERRVQRRPIRRCGGRGGRRHPCPRQGTAVRRRHAAVSQKPAARPVRRPARRLAAAARNRSRSSQQVGQPALYERLTQVDPVAASHIHPHDTRRLIRALEVYRATGEPISHQQLQFEEGRPADECRVFVLRRRARGIASADRRPRRGDDRVPASSTKFDSFTSVGELGRTARQAVGYREALALPRRRIRSRRNDRPHHVPHAPLRQAAGHVVPQPERVPFRRHRWRSGRGGCWARIAEEAS